MKGKKKSLPRNNFLCRVNFIFSEKIKNLLREFLVIVVMAIGLLWCRVVALSCRVIMRLSIHTCKLSIAWSSGIKGLAHPEVPVRSCVQIPLGAEQL